VLILFFTSNLFDVFSHQPLRRNGAEFLKRVLGYNVAYYSDPTWGNHGLIFRNSGFTDVRKHQYWDEAAKGLNFRQEKDKKEIFRNKYFKTSKK